MYIIYRALHVESGRSYIGQTIRSLKDRIRSHYGCSQIGEFQKALRSTKETEWELSIIDTAKTHLEAQEVEGYWVHEFKAMTQGFNSAVSEFSKSAKTKAKISTANKGNIPWNKGRNGVYSEEALERMHLAAVSKKVNHITPEWREKINSSIRESVGKKIINNSTGEIYPSVTEAAKRMGVAKSSVTRVLSGRLKSVNINVSYYHRTNPD